LFRRTAKILELRRKALYFVQPRSEKGLNCEQKYCILFSRAVKILDCEQKHVFGSAAQRKFKALYFIQPRREKF
jgi:hypothetical protein